MASTGIVTLGVITILVMAQVSYSDSRWTEQEFTVNRYASHQATAAMINAGNFNIRGFPSEDTFNTNPTNTNPTNTNPTNTNPTNTNPTTTGPTTTSPTTTSPTTTNPTTTGATSTGQGCADAEVRSSLSATNRLRQNKGAAALTCNENLSREALIWSKSMCSRGVLEHGDVQKKVDAALQGTGKSWSKYAENVLWNMDTEDIGVKAVGQWENSPGHYANMIDPGLTEIGVGYHTCNGRAYWTQIFATLY